MDAHDSPAYSLVEIALMVDDELERLARHVGQVNVDAAPLLARQVCAEHVLRTIRSRRMAAV